MCSREAFYRIVERFASITMHCLWGIRLLGQSIRSGQNSNSSTTPLPEEVISPSMSKTTRATVFNVQSPKPRHYQFLYSLGVVQQDQGP